MILIITLLEHQSASVPDPVRSYRAAVMRPEQVVGPRIPGAARFQRALVRASGILGRRNARTACEFLGPHASSVLLFVSGYSGPPERSYSLRIPGAARFQRALVRARVFSAAGALVQPANSWGRTLPACSCFCLGIPGRRNCSYRRQGYPITQTSCKCPYLRIGSQEATEDH